MTTRIILTDEQCQQYESATDGVIFRDAVGNVLARIPPRSADEEVAIVAEAKRPLASDEQCASKDELLRLKGGAGELNQPRRGDVT